MTSATEMAWCGGFFDGEGCVRLHRHARSYQPRLQVAQVNPAPLDVFKRLFGGYINSHQPALARARRQHTWVVNGKEGVRVALEAMLPYLIVKRAHAETVLALMGERGQRIKDGDLLAREALAENLRRLNKRGTEQLESRPKVATRKGRPNG